MRYTAENTPRKTIQSTVTDTIDIECEYPEKQSKEINWWIAVIIEFKRLGATHVCIYPESTWDSKSESVEVYGIRAEQESDESYQQRINEMNRKDEQDKDKKSREEYAAYLYYKGKFEK